MKPERFPYTNVVLAALFVAWAAPALAFFVSGSQKVAFLAASITSVFLGVVFLVLCIPLGKFMQRGQEEALGSYVPKVINAGLRLLGVHAGWPCSTRRWTNTFVKLAVAAFIVAIVAFSVAIGDTESERRFMQWLEDLLS